MGKLVVLASLDVPLVADHPTKCPGGARGRGRGTLEDGQAFDGRKRLAHDS
jgi:hypothetical protein